MTVLCTLSSVLCTLSSVLCTLSSRKVLSPTAPHPPRCTARGPTCLVKVFCPTLVSILHFFLWIVRPVSDSCLCLLLTALVAMKPIMPSSILRDSSASFARNNSFLSVNRYSAIRDTSPADSRSRSPSGQRKAFDSSYANAAKKKTNSSSNPTSRHAVSGPPRPRAGFKNTL